MIEDGRYSEAYDSLIMHQDDLRTANTIGVSLMMQKKFEEAMPWLEKALQSNSTAAQKNIDSINQEYKWEEQQRKEIEEYLKKYE
jgi:Tfp pilus assembly protein PilF